MASQKIGKEQLEESLHNNNFPFSFNVFIFSTLLLPSAVPDRDACGYLALLVNELKVAFWYFIAYKRIQNQKKQSA